MSLQNALEFYFVFDGLEFEQKYNDIFEAINAEILTKFKTHKDKFNFFNHDKECKTVLKKLARSDRKRFSITRQIPRHLAPKIINLLTQSQIIKIEKSKEEKITKDKHKKLKKELRRYQIQDKIHFCNNFTRFWFRFCEPNLHLLQNGEFQKVLKIISNELDYYFSLPFELACIDFLAHILNLPKNEITSYWDKNNEIDIFIDYGGLIIVGEVKYKSKKVCKDVLNLLMKKCEKIAIEPDFYALFSRSGFSWDLSALKNDKILLFELSDFKELL